jgi:hypothetical protein
LDLEKYEKAPKEEHGDEIDLDKEKKEKSASAPSTPIENVFYFNNYFFHLKIKFYF